jgi:signal transduction histidine kinase
MPAKFNSEGPSSRSGIQDPERTTGELEGINSSLAAENHELKQLAKYHSALLARLVHELRTPLTSIMGFAEILLNQEELTEAQRNFCKRIQSSAQQLRGSLNQLADLSRLESGNSEITREEFAVAELLQESCAAVARQAQKQMVEIRFHADAGLPAIVSDRGRLRQIIFNFLAFAITRTPSGAEVLARAEHNDGGFLFSIEDAGEPVEDLAAFIELASSNMTAGVSELGLAIARHNLELLGARLTFQHRQPRGLQTMIQLPPRPSLES